MNNRCVKITKITSFAGLVCLFTNYALVLILNDYASKMPHLIMSQMLLWSSLGVIASGLLCPLFLPLPHKDLPGTTGRKNNARGIIFIILIMIPNIILRSFGIEYYLSNYVFCLLIHILTGALYPVCSGLLIYSFLTPSDNHRNSENKTGKYCVFPFCIAWGSILLIRYLSTPLFEFLGYGTDLFVHASLAYDINTVLMACICGFVITSLYCLSKVNEKFVNEKFVKENSAASHIPETLIPSKSRPSISDWFPIIIFISLAIVYQIVNSILEMRFHTHALTHIPHTKLFNRLVLAVIIGILGWVAGFSIQKFIRMFLPFAVILFILLPCIILFGDNPPQFINIIRDIMGAVVYRVMAAIFTIAVVEQYVSNINGLPDHLRSKWPGYWFYMLAGFFNITNLILLYSYRVAVIIPAGSGYTVLIIGIAAIIFMLLSFRIIVPKFDTHAQKTQTTQGASAFSVTYEDIYKKHRLTKQEIIVANMIIKDGYNNEKIADSIFRSIDTVKKHVSSILAKFDVANRAELMSKVMREKETAARN